MKLLLIEDADRLRRTLHRGLQSAGFTVDEATDGLADIVHTRRGSG